MSPLYRYMAIAYAFSCASTPKIERIHHLNSESEERVYASDLSTIMSCLQDGLRGFDVVPETVERSAGLWFGMVAQNGTWTTRGYLINGEQVSWHGHVDVSVRQVEPSVEVTASRGRMTVFGELGYGLGRNCRTARQTELALTSAEREQLLQELDRCVERREQRLGRDSSGDESAR